MTAILTVHQLWSSVRSGYAPQVLSALRNAVVHLSTDVLAESRPEAIEILQVRPDLARELIGIPQCDS